jgi:predicted ferric reductase
MPCFRARVYELLKYPHYAAAITYLGLMFWHCGNQSNSWYYLYATVVVFSLSLLGRLIFKTSAILGYNWSHQNFATVQCLDKSLLKVTVVTPSIKPWSPGQHVFLRFLPIRVFANHPFTITSIFKPSAEYQEMKFLIRPYRGFTAMLHSLAVASPSSELSLLVDVGGPYGGIGLALDKRYNAIILVAGCGGISSMLSWLLYLSRKLGRDDYLTNNAVLLWAFREEEDIE